MTPWNKKWETNSEKQADNYRRNQAKIRLKQKEYYQKKRSQILEQKRRAYLETVGELTLNVTRSPEEKRQRANLKSVLRDRRIKAVKFTDELTELVLQEAHDLRIRRTTLCKFKWHVDHIIPLKGKLISGLHIWSNIQVIPAKLNLQKGAKYAIHEERP